MWETYATLRLWHAVGDAGGPPARAFQLEVAGPDFRLSRRLEGGDVTLKVPQMAPGAHWPSRASKCLQWDNHYFFGTVEQNKQPILCYVETPSRLEASRNIF